MNIIKLIIIDRVETKRTGERIQIPKTKNSLMKMQAGKSSELRRIHSTIKISLLVISILSILFYLSSSSHKSSSESKDNLQFAVELIGNSTAQLLIGLITSPQTMHRLWAVENSWKRRLDTKSVDLLYVTGQLQRDGHLTEYLYADPVLIHSIGSYLNSINHQLSYQNINNYDNMNEILRLREPDRRQFVQLPSVTERMTHHITTKTVRMFEWMFHNAGSQYRWFMKLDDDVYLQTDQLIQVLNQMVDVDPLRDAVLVGRICRPGGVLDIMSGGAGYIMSRKLLQLLGPHLDECLRAAAEEHGEDVVISGCIEKFISSTQQEPVRRISLSGMHAHPPHDIEMWRGWDRGDKEVNFDLDMLTIHSVSDLYMLQMDYLIHSFRDFSQDDGIS